MFNKEGTTANAGRALKQKLCYKTEKFNRLGHQQLQEKSTDL